MEPQELLEHIKGEYQVRKDWLQQAKRFRENAEILEAHDKTLATIMRRLALSIEQYEERIADHIRLAAYDRMDAQFDAEQQAAKDIEELFKKVGFKP